MKWNWNRNEYMNFCCCFCCWKMRAKRNEIRINEWMNDLRKKRWIMYWSINHTRQVKYCQNTKKKTKQKINKSPLHYNQLSHSICLYAILTNRIFMIIIINNLSTDSMMMMMISDHHYYYNDLESLKHWEEEEEEEKTYLNVNVIIKI